MLFSEIYSAYYKAVSAVLAEAADHPVSAEELRQIIEKHAFGESVIAITDAFKEERWQLLKQDATAVVRNVPSLPLTILQKQWLKAVACDPRIRLFGDISFDFPDIEPLFLPEDVIVFDQYSDGDDYTDENYIARFRLILDAIRKQYPLAIAVRNGKGDLVHRTVLPDYLEYSEKDDKFRLIGEEDPFLVTMNLGRIENCRPAESAHAMKHEYIRKVQMASAVFELIDERNALERVLLHFAHFEKTAERMEGNRYRITVHYDPEDKSEMVIRILSFGPFIKVTEPQDLIELIRQRLRYQKRCGQ